jgi:hypothetical protein
MKLYQLPYWQEGYCSQDALYTGEPRPLPNLDNPPISTFLDPEVEVTANRTSRDDLHVFRWIYGFAVKIPHTYIARSKQHGSAHPLLVIAVGPEYHPPLLRSHLQPRVNSGWRRWQLT